MDSDIVNSAPQWAMYRNNKEHSGLSPYPGPVLNQNQVCFACDNHVVSGVSVDSDGNIYFGSMDNCVYAVDKNGQRLWSYTTTYPFYSGPPILSNNIVYAASDGIYALDLQGNLLWKYLRRDLGMVIRMPANLSADGNVIFIGESSTGLGWYLISLNGITGELNWQTQLDSCCVCAPAISTDGTIYVGTDNGTFYAIEPLNGSTIWTYACSANVRVGPVISLDGSTIYVGCVSSSNMLYAFNAMGSLLWSYSNGEMLSTSGSIALAADGTIYVGFYGLVALGQQGNLKWETPTDKGIYPCDIVVSAEGNIYFSTQDNYLMAYNAEGEYLWLSSMADLSTKLTLSSQGLYFNTGYNIYLNNQMTIPQQWVISRNNSQNSGLSRYNGPASYEESRTYQAGGNVDSGVAIDSQGNIYFGCEDKAIYALDVNGILLWKYYMTYPIYGGPPLIGVDGTIYVGANGVIALSAAGAFIWSYYQESIGMVVTSPLTTLSNGNIVFVANSFNGKGTYLTLLNRQNGALIWQVQLFANSGGNLAVSPQNDVIYLGMENGCFSAFNPLDGSQIWNFVASEGIIRVPATLLPDGSRIFILVENDTPGMNKLYALDTSGNIVWQYGNGSYTPFTSSIALGADNTIYAGFYALMAFDQNGNVLWQTPTDHGIYPCDIIVSADEKIYFSTQDNYIFCYDKSGNKLWEASGNINTKFALGSAGLYFNKGNAIYLNSASSLLETDAPTVNSISYDGASTVFHWEASSQSGVQYVALIRDRSGSEQYTSAPTSGTTVSIDQVLSPDKIYEASVFVLENGSSGASSDPLQLILEAPLPTMINYDGNLITIKWNTVTYPNPVNYHFVFIDSGNELGGDDTSASGSSTTFPITLNSSDLNQLKMCASSGVVSGPYCAEVDLVVQTSGISSLVYDGTKVSVTCIPITIPGDSQYSASIFTTDGNCIQSSPISSSLNIDMNCILNESLSYVVSMQAFNGIASGPLSQSVAVLLTPVMNLLSYDLIKLNASWNALVGDNILYTGMVYDAGGTFHQASEPTSDLNVQITVTLDPSLSYFFKVVASSGVSQSPYSEPLQAIVAQPVINEADYDNSTLLLDWSEVNEAPVTGYAIEILEGEELVASKNVDLIQTTNISATLPAPSTYTVAVRATGNLVLGPSSPSLTILNTSPSEPCLNYNGTNLLGEWLADLNPLCLGYEAELIQDGSLLTTIAETDTQVTFENQLTNGSIFEMSVRSTGTKVKGPSSSLATAPFSTAVVYNYDQMGRLLGLNIDSHVYFSYNYTDPGNINSIESGEYLVETTGPIMMPDMDSPEIID